jgi:hypothetical protein
MLRLQKIAQYILIAIIIMLAVADAFFIIDMIMSDPVGHLHFNFN